MISKMISFNYFLARFPFRRHKISFESDVLTLPDILIFSSRFYARLVSNLIEFLVSSIKLVSDRTEKRNKKLGRSENACSKGSQIVDRRRLSKSFFFALQAQCPRRQARHSGAAINTWLHKFSKMCLFVTCRLNRASIPTNNCSEFKRCAFHIFRIESDFRVAGFHCGNVARRHSCCDAKKVVA